MRIACLLFCAIGFGQELPPWLAPYPGVTAAVSQQAKTLQQDYSVTAEPALVLRHYTEQLNAAKVENSTNFDGIGSVIKARSDGYEAQIRVRSGEVGTQIRVLYMPFSAPETSDPVVMRGQPMRNGRLYSSASGRSYTPKAPAPAPTLGWPQWLRPMPGCDYLNPPHRTVDQGKPVLKGKCSYYGRVRPAYEFHLKQAGASGYTLARQGITQCQVIFGSGPGEECHAEVNAEYHPNGDDGRLVVNIDISKSKVNDPIWVTFTVRAVGGY